MTRIDHCTTAVAQAFEDQGIDAVDIRRYLRELDQYAQEMSAGSASNYRNILNRLIDEPEFEQAASLARVRRINNLVRRKEFDALYRSLYDKIDNKSFGQFLDNYVFFASESQTRNVANGLSSWMRSTKFKNESGQEILLFDYFNANRGNREAQRNFALEMQAIAAGRPDGVTGDTGAAMIARKISDMRAVNREAMRRAGANIRMRDDYQGRQSLSQHRVRATSQDEFVEQMMEALDWDKMFDGVDVSPEMRRMILSETYENIVNGNGATYGQGLYLDQSEQPQGIGKRYEQSRTFVYKDIDSYMNAMDKFGEGGNLFDNAMIDLMKLARDAAIVDRMGADAALNFRALKDEYALGRPPALFNPDNIFKNITGEADLIGNTRSSYMGAKIAGGTRNTISSAAMGQIFWATLSDAAIQSQAVRRAIGHHQPVVRSLTNIFDRIETPEGRQIFGAYADAYSNQIIGALNTGMSRYGDVFEGGITAWLAKKTYHLGGMSIHEAGGKQGAIAAVSRAQYMMRDKSFAEVNAAGFVNERMEQFGINERMWNFYRKQEPIIDARGDAYLTTDALKQSSDDVIARDYLGRPDASRSQTEAARREMVVAFESYFTRIASNAVLTPTARDRSIQNFGYQRGTIPGELLRTTMHLTTFPIMVINNVLTPLIQNREFATLSLYVMQATALGYISMVARDVMNGRTRDYFSEDPQQQTSMFLEAFNRGGAGGLVFDLFYQWSEFGQDPTGRFGGMSMGAMQDIFDIMRSAQNTATALVGDENFDDELERLLRDTARTARRYMPGGTLPVVQQVVDNLLYYPLQNAIDPSTMRRMERNWEERTGGGYFISPTGNWN